MAKPELRRRLTQLDVLRTMLARAQEEGDAERATRIVSSIDETEARITRLQAEPTSDEDGASRRRRR